MEATGWLAMAVALAGGGNIIIKFRTPAKEQNGNAALEIRLKEYFGYRFDRIADDIKKLSDKGDKQDERLKEFYEEFTELRVDLARRLKNGHDK